MYYTSLFPFDTPLNSLDLHLERSLGEGEPIICTLIISSLWTRLFRLLESNCGTFIEGRNLQRGRSCLLKTFARCMATRDRSRTVSLTHDDRVGLELPRVRGTRV